jgi:hypothetical protein
MAEAFDAYQTWLNIPPTQQPPHHYRLLGLRPLEPSAEAIENAANRAALHVRSFQAGPYKLVAERIYQEILAARACLLDPDRKLVYDRQLAARLQASAAGQSGIRPATAAPLQPISVATSPVAMPAPAGGAMQPLRPIVVEVPFTPAAQQLPAAVPVQVPMAGPPAFPAGAAVATPASQPTAGKEKKKERIPQPVKIIGGGLAGIVLGWIVVYFITGNDVAGILPSRNPPEPVAARQPKKRTTKPASESQRSPLQTSSAPSSPASPEPQQTARVPGGDSQPIPESAQPTASTQPSELPSGNQPPPPTVTPGQPVPSSPLVTIVPAPDPSIPPQASPPPQPMLQPGVTQPNRAEPTANEPRVKPNLQPTPSAEAQQKMLAELKSIYPTEFEQGDKPDGRAEFVAFLLQTARKLKSDPVAQFVLCREAYDRAVKQENFVLAAEVVDELERGFVVDGFRFRSHLLTESAKAAKTADDRAPLVFCALELADYALASERTAEVGRLVNLAEGLARNLPSRDFKTQVTAKCVELRKSVADWEPVAAARKQLAINPQDPAASAIDGQYRCFVAGEWAEGLKLLAQSDHAALAAASKRDLEGASDAAQQVALGDAWFDTAMADPALAPAYARARHWYAQAQGAADGFDKIKIDKRIEQIDAMQLPAKVLGAAPSGQVPRLASARYMLTRLKAFEPTDLIAAITPQTIKTQGWTTTNDYVQVYDSASRARLQSPVNPTGEYQMALKIRREQSFSSSSTPKLGVFVVGLPSLRSQFLVVLDYPYGGKGFASFLTLSGYKRLEDNPTFKLTENLAPRISTSPAGGSHVLVCAVKLGEVIVMLDGEKLMEYKGDLAKLSMMPEWAVPDTRSLFLGSHQGGFFIDAWSVAPLVADDGTELPLMTEPLDNQDRFNRFGPGPRPFNR